MPKIRIYIFIVIFGVAGALSLVASEPAYACDNCGGRTIGEEWCDGTTRKRCVANDGTRICNSSNPGCPGCNCISACVPAGSGYQCSEPDPSCPAPNGNNQNTIDVGSCAAPPTPTPIPTVTPIPPTPTPTPIPCPAGAVPFGSNLICNDSFELLNSSNWPYPWMGWANNNPAQFASATVGAGSSRSVLTTLGAPTGSDRYACVYQGRHIAQTPAMHHTSNFVNQWVKFGGQFKGDPSFSAVNIQLSRRVGGNWEYWWYPNGVLPVSLPLPAPPPTGGWSYSDKLVQVPSNVQALDLAACFTPTSQSGSGERVWMDNMFVRVVPVTEVFVVDQNGQPVTAPLVGAIKYPGNLSSFTLTHVSNASTGLFDATSNVSHTGGIISLPSGYQLLSVEASPTGGQQLSTEHFLYGSMRGYGWPAAGWTSGKRTVTVRVQLPQPTCSITLSPNPTVNMNVGTSQTFTGQVTAVTPPGAQVNSIRFQASNPGILICNPGSGTTNPSSTTCQAMQAGVVTVRAYATVGGQTDLCASNQVTVNMNPTCSITSVLPNPWNVQVGSGPQQFTANVTRVPAGASTTVTFTENDPNNAFSCTPLTDASQPYQTTCTPQGVGSGSLVTTAVVTSGGRQGTCGPFTVPVNISPTPTPSPTPTVGPVQMRGAFVSGEGFEFTRPVVVSGDEAPVTFEYDPKYLVDFVHLIGEALLDWIEVR